MVYATSCTYMAVEVPKCHAGKVLARGANHTPVIFCNKPSCHLGMISIVRPAQNGLLYICCVTVSTALIARPQSRCYLT